MVKYNLYILRTNLINLHNNFLYFIFYFFYFNTITFAIFNIDTLLNFFNTFTAYFLVNNVNGLTEISSNYSDIYLAGFLFFISPSTWYLRLKKKYKWIISYLLIFILFLTTSIIGSLLYILADCNLSNDILNDFKLLKELKNLVIELSINNKLNNLYFLINATFAPLINLLIYIIIFLCYFIIFIFNKFNNLFTLLKTLNSQLPNENYMFLFNKSNYINNYESNNIEKPTRLDIYNSDKVEEPSEIEKNITSSNSENTNETNLKDLDSSKIDESKNELKIGQSMLSQQAEVLIKQGKYKTESNNDNVQTDSSNVNSNQNKKPQLDSETVNEELKFKFIKESWIAKERQVEADLLERNKQKIAYRSNLDSWEVIIPDKKDSGPKTPTTPSPIVSDDED